MPVKKVNPEAMSGFPDNHGKFLLVNGGPRLGEQLGLHELVNP